MPSKRSCARRCSWGAPLFAGDDLTDLHGFEAVQRLGGVSVAVGPRVSAMVEVATPAELRELRLEFVGREPAFDALLTPDCGDSPAGVFAVDLRGMAEARRTYLRNTAVLERVLRGAEGEALRIVDFCPRFRRRGRMFRPMEFVRIVEPQAGRPVVRVRLRPSMGYGQGNPQQHTGSHNICYHTPQLRYRMTTNASRTAVQDGGWFVLDTAVAFILGPDETLSGAPLTIARDFLAATVEYWQDWVRSLAIPVEWQEAVIPAAITLKLCTYEDTGAVLAALTTSIPEHAGSERNWDYRYCWLRDSYFVIQALNRLGATRTMEAYLRYIDDVSIRNEGSPLQPLYGMAGETQLTERIATALPGYRGMGPVRVGNLACLQKQNDVYGAVVLAAAQTFFDQRLAAPGDLGLFQRLERVGAQAAAIYAQPDSGPREFRGMQRTHTFSAAMCWAGCDRLHRIARALGMPEIAADWQRRADAMRETILTSAWNEHKQAYCGSFGGDEIDATTVLLPELGIVSGTDPRFLGTLAAVERELKRGDWLFRYRHPDDFGTPVTAFTICAFWYVNALAAAGRTRRRGRKTAIEHIPIGIDIDAVQAAAQKAQGNDAVQRMVAGLLGRRSIIGVDRLDYSKGLVDRFQAYDRFLDSYPENLGRVTYPQIAPVSRGDVREYAHIRRALEQAAGRTNGKYADTDWTPIRYLNRNYPHPCVLGFMRASQVGLVTPLRDGMNLVAKEFVAVQDPDDPGVLVLSTLAGAARELGSALLVNPKDTGSVARALRQALQMRLPERRARHQQMLEVLRRNDLTAWHTRFVDRLQQARRMTAEVSLPIRATSAG